MLSTVTADEHRIVIVGSGFSGLGLAIRLKQEGIHDFVILERADAVGGTWRDNTYPGCACDIASHLYSFSFAPNPDWSRSHSGQAEIWAYLERCARDHGILPHIRFGAEMTESAWQADRQRWRVQTTRGEVHGRILVVATGGLSEPATPDLPGLERFEGPAFHSARWDHDRDLTAERVAVVGTGASAIQFVPQIQPRVARLSLFQRTPPWIVPRGDRAIPDWQRRLYRRVPVTRRLRRAAIYGMNEAAVPAFMHPRLAEVVERVVAGHLHKHVPDPALRAKLTPDYRIGCKRVLVSDDYYPALTGPNVDVVTSRIAEVRPRSIVTAGGAEHPADTIIFGTGFHVTDLPVAQRLRGRDGRLLCEHWHGSPQAYKGTTTAGFPNAFVLVGPNTGLGHNSVVYMLESQLRYVLDALRTMERRGVAELEVRPEAQAAFNAEVQDRMRGTVWTAGGCASWYLDPQGRNTTLWPGATWRFRRATRRFDPAAYALRGPVERPAPVLAPA